MRLNCPPFRTTNTPIHTVTAASALQSLILFPNASEPYDSRKKCFSNRRSRTTVTKNVFLTVGAVRQSQKMFF